MSLKSFTIVFGLYIVNLVLILSEKSYLLLACKHRSDGKEDLDLVIKRNKRIFKLLTRLQQAIGQIIVVTGILMKGIEYGINFDAHLQVLKDDPNNPLDLFSIGDGEKFPEDGYLVVGGGD